MTKLLNAFTAAPTLKNAQKIAAYARKHPMAICLVPAGVAAVVAEICNAAKEG